MRVSRQFQDRLFSYEKLLNAQKHSQANINQQNKNKQTKSNKGNGFLCTQTSKVKVACFVFWCFLCIWNLFIKKKNLSWNCLDTLILLYYWHVLLSTHLLSHYLHLFLLKIICENLFFLWKSFWILFVCENLFFLLKNFL